MASNHLDDPLDYLYEELSPEEMERARAHLAECPACRESMKRIRETVMAYRAIPPAAPPPGLAARTAQAALAEAARLRGDDAVVGAPSAATVASEAEPDSETETTDPDRDFQRMKEEILGEMQGGWSAWFSHPAWKVAASVLFVCVILIHVSPRSRTVDFLGEERRAPAPAPARHQTRTLDNMERLPPAASQREEELDVVEAAPPALREAEAWSADASAYSASEAAPAQAPAASVAPIAPPVSAPVPLPAEASSAASVMDFQASSSMPLPEPAPPPPPSPPPKAQPAPAPAEQRERSSAPDAAFNARSGVSSAKAAQRNRDAVAGAITEADDRAPALAPETRLTLEQDRKDAPADERPLRPPVVIDMSGMGEPPQLLARPESIDTAKLARDLAVLAGMQIGHGELEDAWISVGLLRKYDPEKADELAKILAAKEEEAVADAEMAKKRAETEEVGAAASLSGLAGSEPFAQEAADKYYSGAAGDAAVDTSVGSFADTAPEANTRAAPSAEPAVSSPSATVEGAGEVEGARSPAVDPPGPVEPAIVVGEVLSGDDDSVTGKEGYYIGPVYSGDMPPPSVPLSLPDAGPPEPNRPSARVPPPTLGENIGGDARRPPRRERFTTDPYFRDE